jgi:hypothetical protein
MYKFLPDNGPFEKSRGASSEKIFMTQRQQANIITRKILYIIILSVTIIQ